MNQRPTKRHPTSRPKQTGRAHCTRQVPRDHYTSNPPERRNPQLAREERDERRDAECQRAFMAGAITMLAICVAFYFFTWAALRFRLWW